MVTSLAFSKNQLLASAYPPSKIETAPPGIRRPFRPENSWNMDYRVTKEKGNYREGELPLILNSFSADHIVPPRPIPISV